MKPKILVLIGNTWVSGQPLLSGWEGAFLRSLLQEAGWASGSSRVWSVFPFTYAELHAELNKEKNEHTALLPGLYHPQATEYLGVLSVRLEAFEPEIIVALGSVASWAVLGDRMHGNQRGVLKIPEEGIAKGKKVFVSLDLLLARHDGNVRFTLLEDLRKVWRIQQGQAEAIVREILILENVEDLVLMLRECLNADLLSFDIETTYPPPIITEVGFAPSAVRAFVVRFLGAQGGSFWSFEDEQKVWLAVREILESNVPKVGQNGLYDIQWLLRMMKIRVKNYQHDTMLLHHALFPEQPRGLAYLGTLYTDDAAWKAEWRKKRAAQETDLGQEKEEDQV